MGVMSYIFCGKSKIIFYIYFVKLQVLVKFNIFCPFLEINARNKKNHISTFLLTNYNLHYRLWETIRSV